MSVSNSLPTPDLNHVVAEEVVNIAGGAVKLGGQTIWQNVNLEVKAGEFIAILGPNGSGKSTLVKTILGLIPLSAGKVTVFGRPARRGNPEIGYVPQRRSFDADVRIRGRDIVQLGIDGGQWGLPFRFSIPVDQKILSKRLTM